MPGEARTSEFLLSTATVMVGPRAKVFELTPELHSIGLVKNVQVSSDIGFVELGQGVQNQVVASVNNSVSTKISAEVYEYTARNMAYGAGIDASGADFDPILTQYALTTAIAAGAQTKIPMASGGVDFSAGDFVVMQDTNIPDRVFVGKVESIAVNELTLAAGYTLTSDNTGWAVATTVIYRVHNIQVGSVRKQERYGVKMVGLLPESGEPVTLIFPKVAITKGIGMSFQTENFSNMPFELSPYSVLPSEPFYSDFGSMKTWSMLRR